MKKTYKIPASVPSKVIQEAVNKYLAEANTYHVTVDIVGGHNGKLLLDKIDSMPGVKYKLHGNAKIEDEDVIGITISGPKKSLQDLLNSEEFHGGDSDLAEPYLKKISLKLKEDTTLDDSDTNILARKLEGIGGIDQQNLKKLIRFLRRPNANIKSFPGPIAMDATKLLSSLLEELAQDRLSLTRVAKEVKDKPEEDYDALAGAASAAFNEIYSDEDDYDNAFEKFATAYHDYVEKLGYNLDLFIDQDFASMSTKSALAQRVKNPKLFDAALEFAKNIKL